MDILKVVIFSFASLVVLFLLSKFIGNRQITEMNLFDYIIGISIGSIAAEMATAVEGDFYEPLIAMVIYAAVAFVIHKIDNIYMGAGKAIRGKPYVLFLDGTLYDEDMHAANIDVVEFLTQCRTSGWFDLSQLYMVILETNGKMSFIPKEQYRPYTPMDAGTTPQQTGLPANVIIDGHIMKENLAHIGYTEEWLRQQISEQGIVSEECVFLATCTQDGIVCAYQKTSGKYDYDIIS